MKKLELNQMENLLAGANIQLKDATAYDNSTNSSSGSIDCVAAGAGLILGALTIGAVTGGVGLVIWGAGMGLNVFGMMRSC
ncbi:hypothetical protein [Flavobacterium soyae]|uniref:Bacteriocin-type signal sequence-containing protein n=1 Tax=Flavobacterium soyae TaxID=2903098 RepID=A0ABZ2UFU2_9FLAO|nr:hypothetical protein [Flavobacterium soyae]MCD9576886.1 hypothetical protein [Flavobacterium soyae]